MAFNDRDDNSQEKKTGTSHPECNSNVNELYRMMKTIRMPDCEFEIDCPDGKFFGSLKVSDSRLASIYNPSTGEHENTTEIVEYKNVTFVWGKKNQFKRSHPISFHQTSRQSGVDIGFSEELRRVLNLIHKDCF